MQEKEIKRELKGRYMSVTRFVKTMHVLADAVSWVAIMQSWDNHWVSLCKVIWWAHLHMVLFLLLPWKAELRMDFGTL